MSRHNLRTMDHGTLQESNDLMLNGLIIIVKRPHFTQFVVSVRVLVHVKVFSFSFHPLWLLLIDNSVTFGPNIICMLGLIQRFWSRNNVSTNKNCYQYILPVLRLHLCFYPYPQMSLLYEYQLCVETPLDERMPCIPHHSVLHHHPDHKSAKDNISGIIFSMIKN